LRQPLATHVLLKEPYARGLAAGRTYAASPEGEAPRASAWPDRDELLWQLLVRTPLREEADALAEMSEMRPLLPAFAARAYAEGFNDGLRDFVAHEVRRRFRPPARWQAILRQSDRAQLLAMLHALPDARSWLQFLTRAVS